MVAQVAMNPLQWTQTTIPNSVAGSSKRSGNDVVAARCAHRLDRSALFSVASPSNLSRTRSCELPRPRFGSLVRKASTASLDAFSDEEFSKKIDELAVKFQVSDDITKVEDVADSPPENSFNSFDSSRWKVISREPPDWPVMEDETAIERKANSLDLPFSLRILKRKKQQSELDEGGGLGLCGSAYCSVKKAFSSMVFIIRELHSHTLQMRELLYYEDLQGILDRVQKEMQASFVWLFQQVFSHTPTLMVSVMILLANFTVHSLSSNAAVTIPPDSVTAATVDLSSTDSTSSKTSIGGNHGGGGKSKPSSASGADGDGRVDRSTSLHPRSPTYSPSPASEETELHLWNAVVEEASRMQSEFILHSLDSDTIQNLVSPVTATIESDNQYPEFSRTELLYRQSLSQDPQNPLLLANFAQFLYSVAHDYDRAEKYFKEATSMEPKDAEACSKYANFLWHVRNDLWGAEETFLEAIAADPSSSYYASNYAHFLWSTGGEETCFPLDSTEAEAAREV